MSKIKSCNFLNPSTIQKRRVSHPFSSQMHYIFVVFTPCILQQWKNCLFRAYRGLGIYGDFNKPYKPSQGSILINLYFKSKRVFFSWLNWGNLKVGLLHKVCVIRFSTDVWTVDPGVSPDSWGLTVERDVSPKRLTSHYQTLLKQVIYWAVTKQILFFLLGIIQHSDIGISISWFMSAKGFVANLSWDLMAYRPGSNL